MTKGDSAANNHYWQEEDKKVLNEIEANSGPLVLLPNNSIISATSQGQLPLSAIFSSRARNAMTLPGLTSALLISIGQLYDDGCNAILNKRKLIDVKKQ